MKCCAFCREYAAENPVDFPEGPILDRECAGCGAGMCEHVGRRDRDLDALFCSWGCRDRAARGAGIREEANEEDTGAYWRNQ